MSYIGDVGRLDSTINSDFSKYTYEYIATEGQTVFTGTDINSATLGYTAGNVLVTYGGADLAFSDYTATDGTSVVLADGAIAGKIIRVVAFQAFEVAGSYTKVQSDNLLANKAPIASPSFTGNLDVTGTVTADGLVVSGATADFLTTLANSTSSGNGLQISAGDNSGDRILQLSDKNGAEKLRVTATGDVGIGTTSPSSKLSVNGIISTADNKLAIGDYLQVISTLNPTNWYRVATFSNSNSPSGAEIEVIMPQTHNSTIIKLDKGTNNWRAEVYRAGYYVNPADSSAYIGINKVRVVDIGTNNYTHVDIQIAGNILEREYRLIVKSSVSGTATYRVLLEALIDQGTAAAGVEFQAIGVMQSWGNESGQLVTIEESGYVGIGKSSPSASLDLFPSATDNAWNNLALMRPDISDGPAEAGLQFQSYPSSTVVANRRAGIQSVSNTGATVPLILNKDGGNVGIGTLTPATTLDVTGTVTADGLVVSGNSYVGSGNTFTDATSGYFFAGNGQYTNGIYGVGVNNVAIAAGGSERMRIDSSGDITTTGNLTIDGFGSGKDISFRSGYGSDNVGIRAKAITTANRDGLEILGYNGIDLTVNNGAKVAVHVDAVGRVTTPYQPSFRAYSPPITVAGNTIIWASTAHNITSSFSTSTGLFTAPVAGTYYFSHSILVRYVSPHYARVVWILNGSTAMINGDNLTDMPGPSYVSVGLSISVYMSANDTIGVVNTGAETYGPGYGHFSGHLLG